MKCPKCGAELKNGKCPHCETPPNSLSQASKLTIQKHPVPNKKINLLVIIIFILMAIIIFTIIFSVVYGNKKEGDSSSIAPSSSLSSASAPISQTVSNSNSKSDSPSTSENEYALPPDSANQTSTESAGDSNSQSIFTSTSQTVETPDPSAAPEDDSGSAVSEQEYNQIDDGMTYEQVKAIIGGTGKVKSEFGEKGSSLYTVTYRWQGYGSSDAYADFTFEDGKLDMKIQFGLK